jgi:subtilisin family serine protease
MRHPLLLVLASLTGLLPPVVEAAQAAVVGAGLAPHRDAEVLVRYRDGAEAVSAITAKSRLGLSLRQSLPGARAELLSLPAITSVESALALLRADPAVELAEPNYLRFPAEFIPNDPLFDQQWGLRNSGQANFFAGGPAGVVGADMKLPAAWDANGDGVPDRSGDGSMIVAVIDDGFQLDHPDLAANFLPGTDTANGDSDPSAASDESHGTLVAGCIGARGNNGIGVAGVAWDVKLLPIRFGFDTASAIAAYDYARGQGAKIINASYGGPGFSQLELEAIARLEQADVLFVAAAGNNDSNIDDSQLSYPANYALPNILSVAASNRQDGIASFSQFGPTTVDITAPGLQIVTTALGGGWSTSPGVTGTSFASPYTAGAAALVRMSYPAADYLETKARLMEGAAGGDDIDLRVASGRLDVAAALDLAPRPNLVIDAVQLVDDGNGALDPGETAQLEIRLRNQWLEATAVSGQLSVDDGAATVGGGAQSFGNLAREGVASVRFPISLPAGSSGHRQLRLRLTLSAAGGYSARRSLLLETGRLQDGQTARGILQTDLYDEFHTWHFDAPAGLRALRFESQAGQDIDLLIKRGQPARYLISLDVDPDSGEQVFETDADQIGGASSGNESVTLDNPAAGTYFVTVVNYAQVENTAYSLQALGNPEPAQGSGGGAFLAFGLLPALWPRRRH